jgi:hypothetical protein
MNIEYLDVHVIFERLFLYFDMAFPDNGFIYLKWAAMSLLQRDAYDFILFNLFTMACEEHYNDHTN